MTLLHIEPYIFLGHSFFRSLESQKEVQKLAQRIKELEEDINHQNESE